MPGELARRNRRCVIVFVATHPGAECFSPDWDSDPGVGDGPVKARAEGAEVRCIKVILDGESVRLGDSSLPVLLPRGAGASQPD